MEDQIPSALSPEQLQSLFENAVQEDEPKTLGELDFARKEEAAHAVLEETNDPLIHKIILHMIVANMIEWHTKVAGQLISMHEPDHSVMWARDAGKWQAIMNILETINVSDDDETCICH